MTSKKLSAFEAGIKKSKKAGGSAFRTEGRVEGSEFVVVLFHADKKGKIKKSTHRFPNSIDRNDLVDIVHRHNTVPGR